MIFSPSRHLAISPSSSTDSLAALSIPTPSVILLSTRLPDPLPDPCPSAHLPITRVHSPDHFPFSSTFQPSFTRHSGRRPCPVHRPPSPCLSLFGPRPPPGPSSRCWPARRLASSEERCSNYELDVDIPTAPHTRACHEPPAASCSPPASLPSIHGHFRLF
jgi:hypothetical protein